MSGVRRPKGEGSYEYDEKQQRWIWKIYLNKRKYYLTSKKKSLLRDKVEQFKKKVVQKVQEKNQKKVIQENLNTTVEMWSQRWLKAAKPTIKIRTYDYYKRFLRLYIIPSIGQEPLGEVTTIMLQELLNKLATNKGVQGEYLSPGTINGIRRTMSVMFSYAVNSGIISFNPVKNTKTLRGKRSEIMVLDLSQVRQLIRTAAIGDYIYHGVKQQYDENIGMVYLRRCYYCALVVEIGSGLRQGELFGLRWSDVDLTNSKLTVRRNMQYSSEGLVFDTPKTDKERVVSLDEKTIKVLKEWQKYQNSYKNNLVGIYNNKQGLLFTNSFGKPVDVSNYINGHWKKLKKAAGIPDDFRWYDLRHTHATLLLLAGVPIKAVSERLGHSTVTQTVNTYYNLIPGLQEQAVNALETMNILGNE